MEQEGSLPFPQQPTVGPYREPEESNKFPYYTYICELVSYLIRFALKVKRPLKSEKVS